MTAIVAVGAAAAEAAPRGNRGPIQLLARPDAVIVAPSAARAHRLRLGVKLLITRPVGRLGVSLNGHPIQHPMIRSGRLGVRLDAAHGLVVGQNLLWVTAGRRGRPPRWMVPVRFVVGYHDGRALHVRLRRGAGRHPAATATLRVPRTSVDRLQATLNGVAVHVAPGSGVLDLAQLGRVHWGNNRLHIRLIMSDGRIDRWSRTFHLSRGRDIAVAKLQGRATVGHSVVLDASRSQSVPGTAGPERARWVLLRRPRNSHTRLGRTRGARITLRPDVPGQYRVALAVGRGARAGYDVQTVSATDPEPLVPLNTIVYRSGVPGVQVGSNYYADEAVKDTDGGPSDPYSVQVVVLERDDLELINNTAYHATSQAFDQLGTYLKSLPDSDLVIVTHASRSDELPADGLPNLDSSLQAIGGSLPAKWTFPNATCWSGLTSDCYTQNYGQAASWQRGAFDGGPFTVIGVPGLKSGQAWRATSAQSRTLEGPIAGYLTLGTDTNGGPGNYTVINGGPRQDAAVDTCADSCAVRIGVNVTADTSPGSATISSVNPTTGYANGAAIAGPGIPSGATIVGGAGSSTVTISSPATASAGGVGLSVDQSYQPPNADGLHVVVLDRTTLVPIVNRTVTTTQDLASALTTPDPGARVGHFFPSPGLDDQRLIILQSVGNGTVSGPVTTSLLQYLDQLGGTPDLLRDAITGTYRYALVGAATNLPWRNPSALESSSEISAIPGSSQKETGVISGAVQRDRDGLYAPLAGDPDAATNVGLFRILYQPAQPWPYAADTEDLKYIAENIGLSATPDVRSAYENPLLRASWTDEGNQLKALRCPNSQDCGPDSAFEKLRQQLLIEFQWVPKVYALGDEFKAPYVQSGQAQYFDVQQVADQVKASVPSVSSSAKATMQWLNITLRVMSLGSTIAKTAGQPGLSAALGLISSAGSLATSFIQQPGSDGGPADAVNTTVGNLDIQLADQQTAYVTWVGQMEKILLYDYGKLSAVGTAIGNDPAWTVDPTTTGNAITALRAGTVSSAYSALLPLAWAGYDLTPDFYTQASSDNVKTLQCNPGGGTVFGNALTENQFPAATGIAGDGSVVNQAWLLSNLNLSVWTPFYSGSRSASLPSSSQTDYIYGKYATGHASDNGTYQYGAYQHAQAWWRDTYNPPGSVYCAQYPDIPDATSDSSALPPPAVTPPLP